MTQDIRPPEPPACPVCQEQDCDHTAEEQAEAQKRLDAGAPALVLSGDEGQQRKRARADKKGENKAIADLKSLMGGEVFRRFMWGLYKNAGVNRLSYVAGAPAAIDIKAAMCFAEGGRSVGNMYLAMVEDYCPAEYALMVSENAGGK